MCAILSLLAIKLKANVFEGGGGVVNDFHWHCSLSPWVDGIKCKMLCRHYKTQLNRIHYVTIGTIISTTTTLLFFKIVYLSSYSISLTIKKNMASNTTGEFYILPLLKNHIFMRNVKIRDLDKSYVLYICLQLQVHNCFYYTIS